MSPARRRLPRRRAVAAALLAGVLLVTLVVWSNALGMGTRFEDYAHRVALFVNPPPDRPIDAEVRVTPRPAATPSPTPTPTAQPTGEASLEPSAPSPTPAPTPTPAPIRAKVNVNLLAHPEAHFITEIDHEWCAVAGTQMVLEIHGKADLTKRFQQTLASRIGEWESRRDSLNGGWGPAAIAAALKAYGVPGYKVRVYDTRADALRDAAKAISEMHAPVVLMTWYGAHTWVMTGYKANADPTIFDDATVTGAYILDPWYPRVSSIWGPSDPPGTFQDAAEMRRNYLPWKRPEGHYPTRDGLFVALVPTVPLNR
jgi:Peptidase_C39 like family